MKDSTFYKLVGGALLNGAVVGGIGTYVTYNNYNHKQEELSGIEERMSHVLYNPDLEGNYNKLSQQAEIDKSNLFHIFCFSITIALVGAYYISVGNEWKQEEDNKQSPGDQ